MSLPSTSVALLFLCDAINSLALLFGVMLRTMPSSTVCSRSSLAALLKMLTVVFSWEYPTSMSDSSRLSCMPSLVGPSSKFPVRL